MGRPPAATVERLPCHKCGGTTYYARGAQCVKCKKAYQRAEYRLFADARAEATKRWHEQNREHHNERMRVGQLRRKFGLSAEDYDSLLAEQGGGCAICGRPCPTGRKLAVDHHHKTKLIRGLLCQACNTGLGKFGDDPERLKAAADYLLRFVDGNVIHTQEKGRTIPKAS